MNDHKTSNWLDERARATMRDNGFEPTFPPDALAELNRIENSPAENNDNADISDVRDLLWSSIDNESSRDLDQVEYAEKLSDGDIRILVGIADVDHLIKKDHALDRHAAKNTVTIYTPTEVFPMLPESVSTGWCPSEEWDPAATGWWTSCTAAGPTPCC